MLRLHLTVEDLVRTRFAAAPDPLLETSLAIASMQRPASGAAAAWQIRLRRAFPRAALPLLDLIKPTGHNPAFLEAAMDDVGAAIEQLPAFEPALIRAELARCLPHPYRAPSWPGLLASGDHDAWAIVQRGLGAFFGTCMAPGWPRTVTAFREDVTARSMTLGSSGFEETLNGLHPDLRWRDGTLLIDRPTDHEITMRGHGLVLTPSASWTGPPLIGPPLAGEEGPIALIYAARRSEPAGPPESLARALGGTRAAVLRSLADPCGTSELARRLRISEGTASMHAAALRGTGLVTTHRQGRSVRHALTPLGQDVLRAAAP